MASHNEWKKIEIKIRTYYYFDNISNVNELDLNNTLLDEKNTWKHFKLSCCIWPKDFIIFDKVDGCSKF